MGDKQIAIRVLLAAEKKGGCVQMGDLAYSSDRASLCNIQGVETKASDVIKAR
jgi:hypothetical protein